MGQINRVNKSAECPSSLVRLIKQQQQQKKQPSLVKACVCFGIR